MWLQSSLLLFRCFFSLQKHPVSDINIHLHHHVSHFAVLIPQLFVELFRQHCTVCVCGTSDLVSYYLFDKEGITHIEEKFRSNNTDFISLIAPKHSKWYMIAIRVTYHNLNGNWFLQMTEQNISYRGQTALLWWETPVLDSLMDSDSVLVSENNPQLAVASSLSAQT